jgi:hypothetical protein
MRSPREKALTQFPAMYITLVSVVQAIALEALAARAIAVAPGFNLHGGTALVWLQVLLLGQTVFYVWISYTLLVTLAQWVFRVFDFGAAFAVGVMQFVAIEFIGRDSVQGFLVVVGLGFVVGAWVSHSNTGAAAKSEDNQHVIRILPRGRLTLLLVAVGVLGVVGVIVSRLGVGAWPIALVLAACNALLLVAQFQWFVWWKKVLTPDRAI